MRIRRRARARVRTFDLVAGRVRTWVVPGAVNPNVATVHTRRHVFVDKWSDGYTHRYAIDLAPVSTLVGVARQGRGR